MTARTQSVIRLGQITFNTGYRGALARRSSWQRTLRRCFRESGPHRFANSSKNTAGNSAAQLENRHPRSADASVAKYGSGQFCGQPGPGGPGAAAQRKDSGYEPAINRAAAVRGRTSQCRQACGRGRENSLGQAFDQRGTSADLDLGGAEFIPCDLSFVDLASERLLPRKAISSRLKANRRFGHETFVARGMDWPDAICRSISRLT